MWRKIMNRVLLIAAIAVAGAAIATPTVLGLSGNTSFTRDIRVPVPSGAHHVEPDDLVPSATPHDLAANRHEDHRGEDRPGHDVAPSATTDDHGGLTTDHHGGLRTDDHGGLTTDDHGGPRTDNHGGPRTDDHGGRRTDNSGPGSGSSGTDDHGGGDDRSGRSGRSGADG
jgi:hypothetical protein